MRYLYLSNRASAILTDKSLHYVYSEEEEFSIPFGSICSVEKKTSFAFENSKKLTITYYKNKYLAPDTVVLWGSDDVDEIYDHLTSKIEGVSNPN